LLVANRPRDDDAVHANSDGESEMAMMRTLAFLLALACALAGCSMSANTAAAVQGVATFHSQLDAGQFEQVYQASSDGL
jgi:ABC-type glycerol-3-phosphate transport system substrate-binding protein